MNQLFQRNLRGLGINGGSFSKIILGIAFGIVLGKVQSASAFWEEKIINGKVVSQQEYNDVVPISTAGGRCTATLIGPSTLITAAHCGGNGQKSQATILGQKVKGTFVMAPEYKTKGLDVAVILLEKQISGIKYRNIGKEAFVGDAITLAGYGCTNWKSRDYGILRKGEAFITRFASYQGLDMILNGQSTICFGDSGGPAFKVENGEEVLIGINSRGTGTTAYNIRLDHSLTLNFLKLVQKTYSKKICGLYESC